MNFKLTTTSLAMTMLLTACGGGGGGGGSSSSSTPVKYFSVDFVKLFSTSYGSATKCQTFGYDDNETPTNKVIGYAATADSDEYSFAIVIHNADGSIVKTMTAADWGSSKTSYKFKQSSVPSDGYVSFIRKSSSAVDSYEVTTFSKSLLPTSFDLAVRRTTTSGSSCIASTETSTKDKESYISNASSGYYFYGFNTYNQDLSDLTNDYAEYGLNADGIAFSSLSNKSVMAVRYGDGSGGSRTAIGSLEAYKILTLSQVDSYSISNPIVLTELNSSETNLTWTAPTDTTSVTDANIYIYQSGTGALLWQPLSSSDGVYSYSSDIDDDNYFLNMSGEFDSWAFSHTESLDSPSGAHDSSTSMSSVGLPSPETVSIVGCSSSALGTCLDTTSDTTAHADTIQRLLITVTNGTNSATQVIYSDYNTSVPTMTFDDTIDDLWSAATASTYEISLLKADSSDSYDAFIYGHLNAYAITSSSINSTSYADRLVLLSSVQQQDAYDDMLRYQPNTWYKASF